MGLKFVITDFSEVTDDLSTQTIFQNLFTTEIEIRWPFLAYEKLN